MTRNTITELIIRLLAIWLFISCIGSLVSGIWSINFAESSLWQYIGLILIITTISVLMVVFSKQFANLIWIGRPADIEVISQGIGINIFNALISIAGLYFIVTSLTSIIHHLTEVLIILPSYTLEKRAYAYSVSRITNYCITLMFGILLFAFSEKVMNIRIALREFLTKRQSTDESKEEK